MNKKIIIAIIASVLLIGLGFGGYLVWANLKKSKEAPKAIPMENATGTAEKMMDEATRAVLPSIQTNPLEDKPDVNPASKANPIKDIKTNPFE
ncbi:MAG: hypothetical protein PHU56_01490 [Candidatus Pacebacteria bacterium]|nr:hypothetical protein [Candidatus Paceibacterota bacterium]